MNKILGGFCSHEKILVRKASPIKNKNLFILKNYLDVQLHDKDNYFRYSFVVLCAVAEAMA